MWGFHTIKLINKPAHTVQFQCRCIFNMSHTSQFLVTLLYVNSQSMNRSSKHSLSGCCRKSLHGSGVDSTGCQISSLNHYSPHLSLSSATTCCDIDSLSLPTHTLAQPPLFPCTQRTQVMHTHKFGMSTVNQLNGQPKAFPTLMFTLHPGSRRMWRGLLYLPAVILFV